MEAIKKMEWKLWTDWSIRQQQLDKIVCWPINYQLSLRDILVHRPNIQIE